MLTYSRLLAWKNVHQLRYTHVDPLKIEWVADVGVEVHAQIRSKSKLFSGAGTEFGERVNNGVSFFDAAIPGTLPVLNKECVRKGIMTALALNCKIHQTSWFDRKHYFYADLPAGYQITQQRAPFATDGCLEFLCYKIASEHKPYLKKSKIKQIQLEQDSGKSIHDNVANLSLVDLNRAGNPLMEIVFEPDLQNGDEAACLLKELILIFMKLDSCSCRIDEGAVRVDANVSVRPKESNVLGIRTEIKNIGGVNNVMKAINYEIGRQIRLCKYGKAVVNETRAWDSDHDRTIAMRDKEVEQDYRFMPEPNLPPLRLSMDEDDNSDLINVPILKKELPELPALERVRLLNEYKLPLEIVLRLMVRRKLMSYFIEIVKGNHKRNTTKVTNYILNDVLAAWNRAKLDAEDCKATAEQLGEIFDMLCEQLINRVIMHRLLDIFVKGSEQSPAEIIEKEQWYQVDDENIIEESCKLTIEFNPEWIEEYFKSKKLEKNRVFQKIYNETLNHTQGRANLLLLKETLKKVLDNKIENSGKR